MKFRKTPEKDQGTYTYHFADGQSVTLKPDQNGVSELNIKKLHSLDDSEVYYNIKNSRPKQTDEEKAAIKEWENKHPGEVTPSNWTISLDACLSDDSDNSSDKSKIMEKAYYSTQDDVSPEVERLHEVVETLTEEQRNLYTLIVLDGYTLTETAKMLGTSIPNIHKRMKCIYKQIKKNF